MTLFLTYCSSDKLKFNHPVAALDLYRSERIRKVYTLASSAGAEFRILSGKYGLVAAEELLPWYDHLLQPLEVEAHANRVAAQLKILKVDAVIFHTRGTELDPQLVAYHDCIQQACAESAITLRIEKFSSALPNEA